MPILFLLNRSLDEVQHRMFWWVLENSYERSEVKDILAYLKLLINPSDEVSLRGQFQLQRGA